MSVKKAKKYISEEGNNLALLFDIICIISSRHSPWIFGLLFTFMCFGIYRRIKKYKDIYREIEKKYKDERRELRIRLKDLQGQLNQVKELSEKIHYLNGGGITENSIIAEILIVGLKLNFLNKEHIDNVYSHRWEKGILVGAHIFSFALMIWFNRAHVVYAAATIYQAMQSDSDISADETVSSVESETKFEESIPIVEFSYVESSSESETDAELIEWSYNFVLPDSDPFHALPKDLEIDVFYEAEGSVEVWIGKKFSRGCAEEGVMTNSYETENENPEELAYFSNLEKKFLEDSAHAKRAVSRTEWYRLAPYSDILDVIINGREDVMDERPIASVYWLLANNYQMYALEYQIQNREGDSILYYYCKSIQSIKLAMENTSSESDMDKMYQYLRMRYLDIANCTKIDSFYRQKAQTIVDAMG